MSRECTELTFFMLSQGRRELEEGIPIGLPLSIEKIIGSCAYDLAEAQRQGVRKSHTLSHTPESFPEVSQLALAPHKTRVGPLLALALIS